MVVAGTQVTKLFGHQSCSVVLFLKTTKTRRTSAGNVTGTGKNGCTGTIVTKDLILTAAHCVPSDRQFRPNSNAARFTLRERSASSRNGTLIGIVAQRRHPSYRGSANDIALLKLARPIPSTHRVMPILESSNGITRNKEVVQAGYGKTNGNDPVSNEARVLRRVDSYVTNHYRSSGGGVISVQNGRTAACWCPLSLR